MIEVSLLINPEFYKTLAKIFCGDETELFTYKTGPQLVDFFNSYFGFSDVYRQGFPTRWVYVNDKLLSFSETGKLDLFFSIILSRLYLIPLKPFVGILKNQLHLFDVLLKDIVCSI